MTLPVVAIVGRPNVGKSSFLNAAAGRRVSIVHDKPGVTRDRVEVEITHGERTFSLVDMGGIGIIDDQNLERQVEAQINTALLGADVILFVTDAREGVTPLDRRIAAELRKRDRPIVPAANKVDSERQRLLVPELASLGLGSPLEVSAQQEIGVTDVLDAVAAALPPRREDEAPRLEGETRIALVGQRNAGKSTLLNALAGEERVIVADQPGTTRDAVDVQVRFGDRSFTVVDTAGFRKARKLADSVEFYGQQRAYESIVRADVVLHLMDAAREVSQVDKKIADAVIENRKPCVLVVNKWDLAEGVETGRFMEYLAARLPLLHYAPVVFISARDKVRLKDLIDVAFDLYDQASLRVGTAELNRVIMQAAAVRGPRVGRGKYPRVYYGTQVGTRPPWFVLFVNEPGLFKDDYRRFVENRLRAAFGFNEIPLRISFRRRQSIFDERAP